LTGLGRRLARYHRRVSVAAAGCADRPSL